MNWQSIDTAPKDGTQVLLYTPQSTIKVHGGYWSSHSRCRCWIAGGYMQKVFPPPPQWWMPLPEPPK